MAHHAAAGPLQTLYRVFVLPTLSRRSTQIHLRNTSFTPSVASRQERRSYKRPAKPLSASQKPATSRTKYNEDINASWIRLVDNETGKLEEEPVRLRDVLGRINTETHRIVQVALEDPKNILATPVCKIEDKKEAYRADKRRKEEAKEKKKAKNVEKDVKTLELNWAIDPNDLGHRLNRMKQFLGEGRQVEVMLAAKKRGRKASPEECSQVVDKVKSAIEEVPGARMPDPMQGKLGGFAVLLIQGKAQAQSQTQAQPSAHAQPKDAAS